MKVSRLPHPMVLLVAFVIVAAAATWLLPAGEYARAADPDTGREVVVAGTYRQVEASPVSAFETLVAIPGGMMDAQGVIFFILLVGGAFYVVEKTGALQGGITWMLHRTGDGLVAPIAMVSILFGIGGALSNTQEEIIAVMPVLLLLSRRLGCDRLTAMAMSLAPAAVCSAFSPVNPFQVVIAQRTADLPTLSGGMFRMVFLVPALAVTIALAVRHARKAHAAGLAEPTADATSGDPLPAASARHGLILAMVAAAFVFFVYGLVVLEWDYDRMSATLFAMGVAAGVVGGLGVDGTARAFADGFREMAPAAVTVGLARAVYVVLAEGRIVDTIVHGLFTPLEHLPGVVSALGMMGAHILLHVPVPSVSGQAVLTMPIAAPLTDLLGMSRQVAVLAYQYGAGLTELITPTNGSMMAVLATAHVGYEDWMKLALPLFAILTGLGAVAIIGAVILGV